MIVGMREILAIPQLYNVTKLQALIQKASKSDLYSQQLRKKNSKTIYPNSHLQDWTQINDLQDFGFFVLTLQTHANLQK